MKMKEKRAENEMDKKEELHGMKKRGKNNISKL